jgi:hypothetical protein
MRYSASLAIVSVAADINDNKSIVSFPNASVGNPGSYLSLSLGAKKATERNACEIEMCNLKVGIRFRKR